MEIDQRSWGRSCSAGIKPMHVFDVSFCRYGNVDLFVVFILCEVIRIDGEIRVAANGNFSTRWILLSGLVF